MYPRAITPLLHSALADTPVVLVNGARQTGKTTLVTHLLPSVEHVSSPFLPAGNAAVRTYLTLDDPTVLSAARSDPAGFIAGLHGPVVLDEVQHAPELFPAIKASVDRDRMPGRYLLTGSSHVLLLPKLSESLAGRVEILTLWPLSQAEISGSSSTVIDDLFSARPFSPSMQPVPRKDLIHRIMSGGYPEPLSRKSNIRRKAWFNSYIATLLQRDVRDMANIQGLNEMPRLLALLAARTAGLLNLSDISSAVQIPYATLTRYMALLEATFLVQRLPAWSINQGNRLVKAPKLLINDTGLAASLLGIDEEHLSNNVNLIGPLLETMVAMELRKQAGWSNVQPGLYHYRTHTQQEVDVVLESPSGQVIGVEVKAAATVHSSDFSGIRSLMQAANGQFLRGIVFYTGDQVIPFAENLHAVPLSLLWT